MAHQVQPYKLTTPTCVCSREQAVAYHAYYFIVVNHDSLDIQDATFAISWLPTSARLKLNATTVGGSRGFQSVVAVGSDLEGRVLARVR